MMPSQTLQVLLGAVVALLYAGAVLMAGVLLLRVWLGGESSFRIREHVGEGGFLWFGFVMGQGILGVVWLALSLAGLMDAWIIWLVCVTGWLLGFVMLVMFRRQATHGARRIWSALLPLVRVDSWYFWLGLGVVSVGLLCGVFALSPPWLTDALNWFLVVPKMIAFSNKLAFQPFTTPHNALYPLQIEMHWAALFTIANETAVTVWDYLCALSVLCGIGYLSWSLTSSRRVVLLAVLMLLTTPAFHDLIGAGKVDNASIQYGLAAFLWCLLWPNLRRRSLIAAGLCVGWVMAGRYTNVIVLPALIVFAGAIIHRAWRVLPIDKETNSLTRFWIGNALAAGIAAAIAGGPMLVKNWLLVGCPLAPHFGCEETFWSAEYWAINSNHQNISVRDLLLYPFVWTFAYRDNMLGNVSPLFLGSLPFLFIYRYYPVVRPALIAGLAALVSVFTWLLLEPLILFSRFLFVPLALLAVPLGASIVAADQSLRHSPAFRWLIRSAVSCALLFSLFQSRAAIYSFRYVFGIDNRSVQYESASHFGYDVASWLNVHVQPGQRVALADWSGYRYLLNPSTLLNSESAQEQQLRWEERAYISGPQLWNFYAQHGFTYVVAPKNRFQSGKMVWPDGKGTGLAFAGQNDVVVKIKAEQLLSKSGDHIN